MEVKSGPKRFNLQSSRKYFLTAALEEEPALKVYSDGSQYEGQWRKGQWAGFGVPSCFSPCDHILDAVGRKGSSLTVSS